MPAHLPSHGARAARSQSDVIDEVDGVPSTHTPPASEHDRMVTTRPGNGAPLPFDASLSIGAIPAVAAMALIVLGAASVAVLTLYGGHPLRVHILVGLLALVAVECFLLFLVAALRPGRGTAGSDGFESSREANGREGTGCPSAVGSDATLLDQRSAPWSGETR